MSDRFKGADERRVGFESLVLQGIWLCILMLAQVRRQQGGPGHAYHFGAELWRGNAISYFDEHGNQNPEAKPYRRATTFPELPRG